VQAIVQERYGGPEVLVSREIERPGIGDREVLVRVHAAGLHIGDAFGVRGSPFPIRFTSGLRGPKFGVPGCDIPGTVEATGSAVTRFAPGDEVFGICSWPSSGACAEYARADEDTLVGKPSGRPPNHRRPDGSIPSCYVRLAGSTAGVVVRDDHPRGTRHARQARDAPRLGPRSLTPPSSGSASRNS
jgi:Zn-dependent alcohol dehydrogenase